MKIKILFFIFFTSSLIYAQNGKVYYNKQLSKGGKEVTSENMKLALKGLKALEYELKFDKNSAVYKKVDALSVENNPVVEVFTQSISGFSGEVYFDKNKVIHKKEFSGKTFLIQKKPISWTLSKETLKIDNFLCYKATTVQNIENSSGSHQILVTAWYAPEISFPYGPDGFGGLPGLILQLEDNGTLTTIKRIEFLKNQTPDISLPTKGDNITEEEYTALVAKTFKNRKS